MKAIPTSARERKQEADFLATFGGVRVLIEEKTKEDAPGRLAERAKRLETGDIHTETVPLLRNETLSGIIRHASKQLQSSSDKPHAFRLIWFTGTGVHAQAKYEQFMATLYGRTNIFEINTAESRRCYFFRSSDFHRRAAIVDGAVAAYVHGNTITARLCLNPLSPMFSAIRESPVVVPFGTAVEDPIELEARGTAFIVDSDLNRKNEGPLLEYLQTKYRSGPLMTLDLGYTEASVLVRDDEP